MQTKKKAARTKRLYLILAAMLLVLFGLLFVLARVTGNASYLKVQDGFRAFFSGFSSGEGYPYTFEEENAEQIHSFRNGLIYLTGDSTHVMNADAKQSFVKKLSFTDPHMAVYNGHAVVYDRVSGNWFLQNGSSVITEQSMGSSIFTAAVGKKRTVAVVTGTEDAFSVLHVYNHNGKELFQYTCVKERIASVSLSPDGKHVALLALGATDAQMYARLLIFALDAQEPVYTEEFLNTTLIKIQFTESGNLLLLGDTLFRSYSKAFQPIAKQEFKLGSLRKYAVDDSGRCAFVLRLVADEQKDSLFVYSKDGVKEQEKSFTAITSIAVSHSYTAVMEGSKLIVLNTAGIVLKEFEEEQPSAELFLSGKSLYAYASKTVTKHDF